MNKQGMKLKALLAEAVWFGTQLAELKYSADIHDPRAHGVRAGVDRLRASAVAFLAEAGLASVTGDDLLPLYREIARGGEERSAACSPETT
jgi:hypothetical protein